MNESNEDISKAFKVILERLKEANKEQNNEPLPNNCCNCKYRHGEEYYDQQWGRFYCGHNWCDKDKSLMDTGVGNFLRGKGHEFISNCPYYEEGDGEYNEIKNKSKYPH
jgi:hypothetical protein